MTYKSPYREYGIKYGAFQIIDGVGYWNKDAAVQVKMEKSSGRQRFLDIELYLKETTTIKETMHLQSRMQGHLEEHFDNITFHLIPLSHRRHEDKDMEYGKDSG